MEHKIRILSTRELRQPIVDRLAACDNITYTWSDFIRIVPVRSATVTIPGDGITAAVFTSANAVTSSAALFPDLVQNPVDIFCLSGATQQSVISTFRKASINYTADNASDLAQQIVANGVYTRVLFFCGEQRRDELPGILASAGIDVQEVVVYRTELTPQKLDITADGILFFSSSAVESFFSINNIPDTAVCFAIGNTTAAAIREKNSKNIIVTAEQPTQDAMLNAVFNHYQLTLIEPAKQ